jgi:hypothetical protein
MEKIIRRSGIQLLPDPLHEGSEPVAGTGAHDVHLVAEFGSRTALPESVPRP